MSRSTLFTSSLAALAAWSATSAAEPAAPVAPTPAPPPAASEEIATADTTVAVPPATAAPTTTADGQPIVQPPGKQIAILEQQPPPDQRVDTVSTAPKPPVPQPTPKIELAAGAFVQSRGMSFDYDPYADGGPPSYPSSNLKGFALSGAVYPAPLQKYDGRMSGIGFSFKLAKSAGSTIVASDDTGTGEYEVDHFAYEAGLHYRYPIDRFSIDGSVIYGNWSHTIVDLPESIDIPDTSYQYLGVGAHLDVYPTEHATIGVGAQYLDIMSSGDVQSEDWYGGGSASGVVLSADVLIPLPSNLFVRGGLEWRKIWMDFDGTGILSDYWGVGTMTDTSITGTAQVGVQF